MPDATPVAVTKAVAVKKPMPMFLKVILGGCYTLALIVIVAVATFLIVKATELTTPTPTTTSTNPAITTNPNPPADTKTPSSATPTTIYFYSGSFNQGDPTPGLLTSVAVARQAPAGTTDLYKYAFDQLLAGPTTVEKASGLRVAFAGFTGTSNCGAADYTISETATVVKLQFCKTLDLTPQQPPAGGAYAGLSLSMGSNAREEIKSSLKFGGITTVEVRDANGQCYTPDVRDPDCTPN